MPEGAPVLQPAREAERAFYDARWEGFRCANALQLARAAAILEGLLAAGFDEPRICDLGCGPGWLTAIAAQFGPATGVELSEAAVAAARRRHPQADFIAADFFDLDWTPFESRFDIVISHEVIEHAGPQDRYIELAARLLRPRGCLILTTPNARTMAALTERQRQRFQPQPVENFLTAAGLRSLLSSRFHIERLTTLIPGYGRRGSYRIAHSTALARLLRAAGLGALHAAALRRFGYGLHLYALAQKR